MVLTGQIKHHHLSSWFATTVVVSPPPIYMQFQFQFYLWGFEKIKRTKLGCWEIFLQGHMILSTVAAADAFFKASPMVVVKWPLHKLNKGERIIISPQLCTSPLRFIHNWVLMAIQWMVFWWVGAASLWLQESWVSMVPITYSIHGKTHGQPLD
jgi:hypothetical protein